MGGQKKKNTEKDELRIARKVSGLEALLLAQACVLSDQLEKSKAMVKRRESGA
jgi:hypothetical protein